MPKKLGHRDYLLYQLNLNNPFEKTRLAGVIRGLGLDQAGAVHNFPEIKQAARDMGASV